MIEDRVEYFESNDMLFGHNLDKIETMPIPEIASIGINDAIEFYEIKRYFDKGIRFKSWSDKEYEEYYEKGKKLFGLTMHFFNMLDDNSIVDQYTTVDISYCSEFWALFDVCKLYNKISDVAFNKLIHTEHIKPFDLFRHKKVVEQYGEVLRQYILDNECCILIILHVYEQDYTCGEKLFLPVELTGENICDYLKNYVDSDNPTLNNLDAIYHMQRTQRFPISDELRLKAKREYDMEIKNISVTAIFFRHGIQLSFSPDQKEEKRAEHIGNEFCVSYSTQWLLDTLDYPSILNNFIYIFEFVDVLQMRSEHVSKSSESGIFERILSSESLRVYPCNFYFDLANNLATLQMNAYYKFLTAQNIRLEDVLKWFFTEYLQKEFGSPEIRVLFPSYGSTYAEKCSTIISTFEAILKQFSLYVKNGNIDFDLIGMSTTPTKFENIPSLVPQKYIYGTGKDFEHLTFILFSDQCMFTYVERIYRHNRNYTCFLDLLQNEQIFLSDYREDQRSEFTYLADFDLIKISSDGHISIKDTTKLTILRDLYKNSVISRWHYPPNAYSTMQQLLDKGVIIEKSSLFSDPEINYLNYLLNRAEYSNGLEIRNKYVHGIQQVVTDENVHMQNYYILLRIFVLLSIKINDDFELKEFLEKNEA